MLSGLNTEEKETSLGDGQGIPGKEQQKQRNTGVKLLMYKWGTMNSSVLLKV